MLWAASTPSNDTTFAKEAGSFWNGKIGVNAELTLLQGKRAGRNALPPGARQVHHEVGPVDLRPVRLPRRESRGRGLADAEAEPDHCEGRQRGLPEDQELETDLLCKPWYYGNLPGHVPSNWDITVTPKDGQMVQREPCFPIAAVTPELKAARAAEAKFKLHERDVVSRLPRGSASKEGVLERIFKVPRASDA